MSLLIYYIQLTKAEPIHTNTETPILKEFGFNNSQVRTVSAANKKCPWHLAYAQLFFDILGT